MSGRKPVLSGIRIDVETKSVTDIKAGSYRYAEDPDFDMITICYAPLRTFPGGAVKMGDVRELDQYNQNAVNRFAEIIEDPAYTKYAFNANFERVTLSRWLGLPTGEYIDPKNWRCSAVQANVHGIFGTLDEVAKALRAPITKDPEGRRLIRLFTSPDKKLGDFHSPTECRCGVDHSADHARFVLYCKQDVRTEAAVAHLLPETPAELQHEYEMDQRINDRGFLHDERISTQAVAQVEVEKDRLMGELKRLTGLDNPNSNQQMQGWLEKQGYPMDSLNKESREEALADMLCPDEVIEALTLKGAASLSSVSKHKAALATRSGDGRIRGSLRYYGAHTGREAGRGIQPQNLPRYEAPEADRNLLLAGRAGARAPEIAKGTVRASIVPRPGHVFVTVDYNAIEGRTLGWAAGETWVNAEFAGEGKFYEATASQMFSVSKAAIVAGRASCSECGHCQWCELRGRGKVSALALGYAGGAGALVTMGAEDAGIDIGNYKEINAEWVDKGRPGKFFQYEPDRHDYPELIRLRDQYREASPATARFWKLCARAWDIAAVEGKGVKFGADKQFTMLRDGRHNRLVLPSGRSIWYRFARSHPDEKNPERIDRRTFIGKSKGVGHTRVDTHGGRLCENINQALARDVLFDLMEKIEALTAKGYPGRLVLHVHDEVVLEVPERHAAQVLADVKGMMATPPTWAPGLAVRGAGDIMTRYGK